MNNLSKEQLTEIGKLSTKEEKVEYINKINKVLYTNYFVKNIVRYILSAIFMLLGIIFVIYFGFISYNEPRVLLGVIFVIIGQIDKRTLDLEYKIQYEGNNVDILLEYIYDIMGSLVGNEKE